jgi:hypothetical protein
VSGMTAPPFARVNEPGGVPAILKALGIATGRPVLVVVGGAGGMSPEHMTALAGVAGQLIQALGDWGAAVVDGGTDSGVMRVIGHAHDTAGASFPLVGVAAEGTVVLPGACPAPDAAPLDPRHTQVILVPGDTWGDESPWLSRVAAAIADGWPSATLVGHRPDRGRHRGRRARPARGPEGRAGGGLPRDQGRPPRRPRSAPLGDRLSPGSAGSGDSTRCAPRGGPAGRRSVLTAGHRAGPGT